MKAIMRAAAVLSLVMAASAYGGAWTNAAGSATNYSWANGQDANGLFGGPVSQAGDDLFFNLDFSVAAGDPAQYDMMSVDLTANPGKKFGLIRFYFAGSLAVLAGSSVSSTSTMAIHDIPNNIWYAGGPYSTTPYTFPLGGDADGSWSGLMAYDLSVAALDATAIHLDITQTLSALGDLAMIDIQQGDLRLEIQMIPEPGTLALLGLGVLGLLRRR
jgi:hypothetical protein